MRDSPVQFSTLRMYTLQYFHYVDRQWVKNYFNFFAKNQILLDKFDD